MKIFGQPSVLLYLTRSLTANRAATSLLFTGLEGTGKRTTALALAESLFCVEQKISESRDQLGGCGRCEACEKIRQQAHPDVLFLNAETQALILREKPETQRSVKIEAIREVDKFLQLKPLQGRHRLVVIEEADTMTIEAAHALLKTLEEPPANGRLILISQDERALPSTILSRCAILRFRPLPETEIAQWLNREKGAGAEEALEAAARSGGSLARALRFLEEEATEGSFSTLEPEEFFSMLSEPAFRKEGRERAGQLIRHLLEKSRRRLETGAADQAPVIRTLLRAEHQLERNVTPRVVLESVYMALRGQHDL